MRNKISEVSKDLELEDSLESMEKESLLSQGRGSPRWVSASSQSSFDPKELSINPKSQPTAELLPGLSSSGLCCPGGHRTRVGADGSSSMGTPEHTPCSATSCIPRAGFFLDSFWIHFQTRQTWQQTLGLGLGIANNSRAGNWLRHSCFSGDSPTPRHLASFCLKLKSAFPISTASVKG